MCLAHFDKYSGQIVELPQPVKAIAGRDVAIGKSLEVIISTQRCSGRLPRSDDLGREFHQVADARRAPERDCRVIG